MSLLVIFIPMEGFYKLDFFFLHYLINLLRGSFGPFFVQFLFKFLLIIVYLFTFIDTDNGEIGCLKKCEGEPWVTF